MFNNIESIFILSGIGLYCLITLISNIVFWIEYFKAKEHEIELNSQQKEEKKEGKPHTSPVSVVIEGDTSPADTPRGSEGKDETLPTLKGRVSN